MDKNVIDDDVSPARIKPKSQLTWNTELICKDVEVTSEKQITFIRKDKFRYAISNESFESGFHEFKLKIVEMNIDLQDASIGISWVNERNMDKGVYYFEKSHIYCNAHPTITDSKRRLTTNVPKFVEGDIIGVTVDFDNKTISFYVNDSMVFSTELTNGDTPLHFIIIEECRTDQNN